MSARCSECGQPCPVGVNRLDAANHKHRYHVDCWARASWWLNGHNTRPTVVVHEKGSRCVRERTPMTPSHTYQPAQKRSGEHSREVCARCGLICRTIATRGWRGGPALAMEFSRDGVKYGAPVRSCRPRKAVSS